MSLVFAKIRTRRRAHSRGAVLFIVAMTIAVLAGLGLYSLRIAQSEIKAAGYQRQSAQTHYLSEYAGMLAAQTINSNSGQLYQKMATDPKTSDQGGTRSANCVSLPQVPSTAVLTSQACIRLPLAGLGQNLSASKVTAYTSASNPGSLGSAPIEPDFFAEITDFVSGKQASGYSGGQCFTGITVTSVGIVRPITSNTTGKYGNSTAEMTRARMIWGPQPCQ